MYKIHLKLYMYIYIVMIAETEKYIYIYIYIYTYIYIYLHLSAPLFLSPIWLACSRLAATRPAALAKPGARKGAFSGLWLMQKNMETTIGFRV